MIGSSSLEDSDCWEEVQSSLIGLDVRLFVVTGSSTMIFVSVSARPLASMLNVNAVRVPETDSGIELKLTRVWCFKGEVRLRIGFSLVSVLDGLDAIVES
jgi:hypothetical protein